MPRAHLLQTADLHPNPFVQTVKNQFAAQFETQKQIIESYARFLDTAVSSYDTLEATIQNNAGSF